MATLLSGDPKALAKLTVGALATEAGVSRSTLYRYPELVAAFDDKVTALRNDAEASHPVVQLERLKADFARRTREHREEVERLEAALRTSQQQVNFLVLERELAAQRAGDGPGSVVPIASVRHRDR
jgi:AcrR family transcriptional regulator